MVRRAVVIWCVLLAIAAANGAAREALLIPRAGEVMARAISTIALSFFIAMLTWVTIGWIGPRSKAQAWMIAFLWLTLTLAFEFLAGHYLFGNPWSRLIEDYDVRRGRIWILVLVTTLAAPPICARLRERPSAAV